MTFIDRVAEFAPSRAARIAIASVMASLLAACGGSGMSPGGVPPAKQAPVVTTNPADQTITQGQTATFTVVASGAAPLAYQWQRGATPIAGATAASYTTPATIAGDSGATFAVVVSNSVGSVTSASGLLTVTAPTLPSVTINPQPVDQTVAVGATAAFTIGASCSDGSPATFQWQRSNDAGGTYADIPGATSATYGFIAAAGDNAARFRASAACGSVRLSSAAALLTLTTTATAGVGPCYGAGPRGGWCWQNRDPVSVSLYAGTAASASTAWAIGTLGVVIKTVNGGTSWQRVRGVDPEGGFYKGMAAADLNTVWAVGVNGRIIKTNDGGVTWNSQASGTTDILNDVVANGTSVAWAVGVDEVLRTTDGGTTWLKLGTLAGPLLRLAAPSATTAFVNGQPDRMSRTLDGGLTWTTTQLLNLNGGIVAIAATSDTVAWAVSSNGVLQRTTDGTTWNIVSTPVVSSQAVAMFASSAAVAYVAYGNGVIIHTVDGGATWGTYAGDRFAPTQGFFSGNSTTVWGVGEIGSILKTQDAGTTWVQQSRGPGLQLTSVSAIDANTAWVAGFGGIIARSIDGGASWPIVHDDSAAVVHTGDSVFEVGGVSASVAWAAGGFGGVLLKTTDGGATWQVQSGFGTQSVSSVTVVDANSLWITGASGFIARTVDGGANWATLTTGTTRLVRKVYALNAQLGYAIRDDGGIMRTADGGTTWTSPAGFTGNQVTSIAPVDANTVVTVSLNGIIQRSVDGGSTFATVPSGTTQDLFTITRGAGNTLWAGGMFQIFKSDDAGVTWRAQPIPLDAGTIEGIAATDSNTAWAVSLNSGILHTIDGGD